MAFGPGLRKAKLPALLRERWVHLVALTEGRVRDLLESADVVSEGSVREESGGPFYYGTTSLIIARSALDGVEGEVLTHAVRCDPHTRLRLVRIAHREACSRTPSRIGALTSEMEIEASPQRITIRVDVSARVLGRRRASAE